MNGQSRRTILKRSAAIGTTTLLGLTASSSAKRTTNDGEIRWTFQTEDAVIASATVVDGTVFVPSTDHNLYALDAESGDKLLAFDPLRRVETAPAVYDDVVFVGTSGNKLSAVDPATGEQLWYHNTEGRKLGRDILSSPTVVDDVVYIGMSDHVLHALDVKSGDVKWTFEAEDNLTSPTVYNGTVYIASVDNHVYAIDAETGDEEWRYDTGEELFASPTVYDGTVFVGAVLDREDDGSIFREDEDDEPADAIDNFFAIDAEAGDLEWSNTVHKETGGGLVDDEVWTSPTAANGLVYAGTADRGYAYYTAFDAETGDVEWRIDTSMGARASPTVVDDIVFFADKSGLIRGLDAETGEERWEFDLEEDLESSPIVVDGILYIGTDEGTVYAIDTGLGGSSDGTRLTLGTLGHHDSFDGARVPTIEPGATGDDDQNARDGDPSARGDEDSTSESETGDALPGPGILGSLASVGAAGYLLDRRLDHERE